MAGDRFPVLWLCGPSGVGKSTVGWEIHTQLPGTGYVDTDQLGLCSPVPADDPANHRIKAANLAAMLPAYRTVGREGLIVSGILENATVARRYTGALPGAAVTLCRLRVRATELRDRIHRRGWLTELAEAAVREAEAMDRNDFADLCVDTTGLSTVAVARLVLERWAR
ncbi:MULTISPECIES: AAA family ATPase [unclassified Crossiella]|uniref:AAA family ATPase n=1 Tax=unclassified Crossiella TaxID=2620835 RepID=UPI001FFE7832|nr:MULTISPECIES: AAA family ATPase [unclassified Crossiella]MCK2241522.1 hypothetical protein [Crossiella sp. S99.2]MCK2255606.1 hypothetical protein [Crossiella sp. S99.1]